MSAEPIAFVDLAAQRRRLEPGLSQAISRVLDHGAFIMGPEIAELETQLAAFCGAKHVISCANGTDALGLVLMAKGVRAGDAVFCPSFTFAATAEVVAWVGATPVFVDVLLDTFNLDPASLETAIKSALDRNLRPTAVIPVDLFGQPADYDAIEAICTKHGLWILSDAAQSFGATYCGRLVGTIGLATSTSFFPAKPLGCYGDGGAIFTDDAEFAATLRSLRVHGQGSDKYDNVRIGLNARLDTLQAAILLEKLKIFADEIEARKRVAARYGEALRDLAIIPTIPDDTASVFAQYTIRVPGYDRAALQAALRQEGVPTAVYYERPLHWQTAYAVYPTAGNGLPVSEKLAGEVISLPMHAYLDAPTQDRIVTAVRRALKQQERRPAAE